MGLARPLLLALFFALAGCKSDKERHLESLEADWQRTIQLAPTADTERIAHFEAFLRRFPAQHSLGNPHAPQAQQQIEEARAHLREQEAAQEQRKRLAASLQPLLAEALFRLAAQAEDIWRDSHLVRLENEGVHLVTRGTFVGRAWEILRDMPLGILRKALGASIYDARKKRYDPDALARFLDAAYLAPDTALLGTTTRDLFPLFRRRLRNELRLYLSLSQHYAPHREELEEEFSGLQAIQRMRKPGEGPTSYWTLVRHRGEKDRRLFYAYLVYRQNVDGLAGIAPGEVSHLDVGFWVRRFEDGTATLFGTFLRKVLQAYDAEWLASVDKGLVPFTGTQAWLHSELTPWLDALPVTYQKSWPEGDGIEYLILMNGQDAFISDGRRVRFDPPQVAPEFQDPSTGDRLLRHPAKYQSKLRQLFQAPGTSDPLGLMDYHNFSQLDPTSLQPLDEHYVLRDTEIPERIQTTHERGLIALGARNTRQDDKSSAIVLVDARSGAQVERFQDVAATDSLAVNGDGSIVAGNAGEETTVLFRAGLEREPLSLRTRGPLALHPTLPLLVSGEQSTELWDLDTGTRLQTLREGEPVTQRAFDPSGQYLWSGGSKILYLDTLDSETRRLIASRKLSASRPTGQWLPGIQKHLLVHEGGVVRIVDAGTGKTVGRPVRAEGVLGLFADGKALLLGPNREDLLVWSFEVPRPPPAASTVE